MTCAWSAGRRIHFSATDLKLAAQSVLKQHIAEFEHIFSDVLDRLFDGDRRNLVGISEKHLAEFKCSQAQHAKGDISETEIQNIKSALGESLLKELASVLEQIEFRETAHCIKHDTQCPISPRFVEELADFIWAEAAGNTCCPWSSMSASASMWLDSSTLPFLVRMDVDQ